MRQRRSRPSSLLARRRGNSSSGPRGARRGPKTAEVRPAFRTLASWWSAAAGSSFSRVRRNINLSAGSAAAYRRARSISRSSVWHRNRSLRQGASRASQLRHPIKPPFGWVLGVTGLVSASRSPISFWVALDGPITSRPASDAGRAFCALSPHTLDGRRHTCVRLGISRQPGCGLSERSPHFHARLRTFDENPADGTPSVLVLPVPSAARWRCVTRNGVLSGPTERRPGLVTPRPSPSVVSGPPRTARAATPSTRSRRLAMTLVASAFVRSGDAARSPRRRPPKSPRWTCTRPRRLQMSGQPSRAGRSSRRSRFVGRGADPIADPPLIFSEPVLSVHPPKRRALPSTSRSSGGGPRRGTIRQSAFLAPIATVRAHSARERSGRHR